MSTTRPRPAIAGLAGLVIAALLAGCGGGGNTSPSASTADTCGTPPVASPAGSPAADASGAASVTPAPAATPAVSAASGAGTKLVVGLGYIPSVQFAQFYYAKQQGYYSAAGLDIEFQNKIDPDLITLVGQGAIDVGIGDGTSVIPAASNGIPVQYVATIYGKFPNIVFAKATSGITEAADLKGRKVGTPGTYGSSWIMLQALLASANMTTNNVQVVTYPDFTQRAAVEQGAVDAATGFTNNEPVQLELDGCKASILAIDAITPLPGPGLIAAKATIDAKHDAIAAFVGATLKAMTEIKANPSIGLDAAIAAVPELASARAAQSAILAATIATWAGSVQDAHGLGAIDRDGWATSATYLGQLGLVKNPVTVDDLIRTDLLPPGG